MIVAAHPVELKRSCMNAPDAVVHHSGYIPVWPVRSRRRGGRVVLGFDSRRAVSGCVVLAFLVSAFTTIPGTVAATSYADQAMLFPAPDCYYCDVAALAVGDTDADGECEIVMGCTLSAGVLYETRASIFFYTWNGLSYSKESSLDTVAVSDWGNLTSVRDVAIGDLDRDGVNEVVVTGSWYSTNLIIIYSWNGTQYDVVDFLTGTYSGPVVADGDSDGRNEIYSYDAGVMRVIEMSVHGLMTAEDWPLLGTFVGKVTVADIDADMVPEIVLGLGGFGLGGFGFMSIEWNGTGYALDHYVSADDEWGGKGARVGDLDLDGIPEVVSTSCNSEVNVYGWNGTSFVEEWHRAVPPSLFFSYSLFSTIVADTDDDTACEIVNGRFDDLNGFFLEVIGYDGGYAVDWTSGPCLSGASSLAVGDLDGDGGNETIAGYAAVGAASVIQPYVSGSPYASLTVTPAVGTVGEYFVLNATGSSDPEDGQDLQYRWDWDGDGVWDTAWSDASVVNHSYPIKMTYIATLAVMDSDGFTDLAFQRVQVYDEDTEPPLTTVSVECLGYGDHGWLVGPVYVYLTAIDNTSMVELTYARVDDGDWTATTIVGFPYDTWSNLSFYSCDVLGNVESVKTVEIKIDAGTPWTSWEIEGTRGSGDWYISGVNITLCPWDSVSGISETLYSVDGGSWESYSGPVHLNTSGLHELEYYSTDFAGNIESPKTTTVRLDVDGPALEVSPPYGTVIKTESVTLNLSVSDANGVDRIETYFDGYGPMTYAAGTTQITVPGLKNGDHTITVVAYDIPGNSQEVVLVYTVDIHIPGETNPWLVAAAVAIAALSSVAVAIYYLWPDDKPPEAKKPG